MPAPPTSTSMNGGGSSPWVEIIEEPSAKSTRFRYECEGRFAGSILGKTSTNERKQFPAIKVHNHTGACVVVVSLVTHDDEKPKPHPHTLVGPECRQGVCTKKVKSGLDCIQFPNLGIQCKKKAELKDALTLRQQIRVDPFRTGFDHMEKPQLNNINLMVVKLCFQVFLPDDSGKYQRPLPPVCSTPIHDKKSAGELCIHTYLPESCGIDGKEEMILLTGRLPKADELEVRFFEGLPDKPDWEGFATFTQKDVHQSVALTIKIPEYTKQMTRSKQQVMFELRKKHAHTEKSTARKFFYLSQESRNRHRPGKRELSETESYIKSKKPKHEPGSQVRAVPNGDNMFAPAVLDDIETSVETNSSVGSGYNNNAGVYMQPPNGAAIYNQQQPAPAPVYQQYVGGGHQQQQPQYVQMQPAPIPVTGPITVYQNPSNAPPGQELMRVRASDVSIYRNDDSGKVFMAPGPTAANRNAPEIELGEDVFQGAELSIDEILKMARENPDSEIYIPSNLSEHIGMMLNPTVGVEIMEEEVVQSSDPEPHTTSLTKELKTLPTTSA